MIQRSTFLSHKNSSNYNTVRSTTRIAAMPISAAKPKYSFGLYLEVRRFNSPVPDPEYPKIIDYSRLDVKQKHIPDSFNVPSID